MDAEKAKKDLTKAQADLAVTVDKLAADLDRFVKETRESSQRTDQRVGDMMVAIGELIRRTPSPPPQ